MTTVIKGLSKTIATMRPGMQSGWSGYVKNGMEKYCAGEENYYMRAEVKLWYGKPLPILSIFLFVFIWL